MRSAGLDITTSDKRMDIVLMFDWMRKRKALQEAGVNKILMTILGGLATAVTAAILAVLMGKHPLP